MRQTTDDEDVRVLDLEDQLRVVLVGLGPVYTHGLSAGLTAAGMLVSSANDPVSATGQVHTGIPAVLVVAQEQAAVLEVLQRGLPDPPAAVVHVVLDLSADACSEAFGAGATGIVATDAELDVVVDVVRAASTGTALLPVEVVRALCRPQTGPRPQVSPQEREWLLSLAGSATVGALARTSGYSEREMYRLLGGLYLRLGASGRIEALLHAERWGLLDPA